MNASYLFLPIGIGLMPAIAYSQVSDKPNIVFILADDLGYGDLSVLNELGKIHTPNLDQLAQEGVTFLDAHSSSAVSTPTRYGLLTGRYNWRSRLKKGVLTWYDEPLIDHGRTTMASMLRSKGYETACIGKWHLGMNFPTIDGKSPIDTKEQCNIDFSKEIKGGPCDIGFDYFFGVDAPNYPPYCFIENRQTIGIPDEFYSVSQEMDSRAGHGLKGWNMEKVLPAIVDIAVDFIEKSDKGKPFFLYLPLTSPHTPIVPTKEFKGKSGLNLYADFVMQTDAVVGRVLRTLDKKGISDNTIVVFTSDNGCSPRAEFDKLAEKGHDPSYIFKGMKSDLYEGGHHVPCFVSWPSQIKPHAINQTICLTDFMATFASLVGYSISDNEAEDSYNLLPLLFNEREKNIIREATVHHSIDGSFAIRQGKWKLLLSNKSGGWTKVDPDKQIPYQLYDMERDPEEEHNVYLQYPEIAEKMRLLLVNYVKNGRSTQGVPQQNDSVKTWEQLSSWMTDENNFADKWKYGGIAIEEPGYHLWGSSPIWGEDGKVHIFTTRWRIEHQFDPGWRSHSEIAHYVADRPEGPFRFVDIVLQGTGKDTWDKCGIHNPAIHKVGNQYVLLYISNNDYHQPPHPANQRIGMLIADNLYGPWQKVGKDGCILSPSDNPNHWTHQAANGVVNPALLQHPKGGFLLYFKSNKSQMGVAFAEKIEGPYVMYPEPVTKNNKAIEDGYAFIYNDKICLLTTDNHGILEAGGGILWKSDNGLDFTEYEPGFHRFDKYLPAGALDHAKQLYGAYPKFERPQVLMKDGKPAYLYVPSGANIKGGKETMVHVLRFEE